MPERVTRDPDLDLLLPDPDPLVWTTSPDGLTIHRPLQIASAAPVGRLSRRLAAANAFSVALDLTITDLIQTGPARIVTVSRNTGLRNLTIGQVADQIDLRVRTRRTGLNGARVKCRTQPGAMTLGRHHVVATFDDGLVAFYIDGKSAGRLSRLYLPAAMILRATSPLAEVITALLLFVPVALVAPFALRARSNLTSVAFGAAAVMGYPIVLSIASSVAWGRPQQGAFLIAAVMASLAGASVGQVWRRSL